jgi:3-hydroxyisobutyrate dehydrogenase-like beta-hydroxyacid dehydrogenase
MERIGFIGLGTMGAPMAGHLAAAGYPLAVYDLDGAAAERLVSAYPDVAVGTDAGAVGRDADFVITMLPDGNQVQRVALEANGLTGTMAAGSLLVDCSSSQPWLTRQTAAALADRGIGMIDAPVSGAQWGARAADLVFMVGGTAADVERIRPVLLRLGRAIFHLGPLASGHIMKCVNNTITAMTLLATAEGLVLGTRSGLDPAAMNAVLNESTGGSWLTRNHVEQRIVSRTFDDPFKLELMLKDIRTATELARSLDLALPYAALAESMYQAAHVRAGPGKSLSEVVRLVEELNGVEIAVTGRATPFW